MDTPQKTKIGSKVHVRSAAGQSQKYMETLLIDHTRNTTFAIIHRLSKWCRMLIFQIDFTRKQEKNKKQR